MCCCLNTNFYDAVHRNKRTSYVVRRMSYIVRRMSYIVPSTTIVLEHKVHQVYIGCHASVQSLTKGITHCAMQCRSIILTLTSPPSQYLHHSLSDSLTISLTNHSLSSSLSQDISYSLILSLHPSLTISLTHPFSPFIPLFRYPLFTHSLSSSLSQDIPYSLIPSLNPSLRISLTLSLSPVLPLLRHPLLTPDSFACIHSRLSSLSLYRYLHILVHNSPRHYTSYILPMRIVLVVIYTHLCISHIHAFSNDNSIHLPGHPNTLISILFTLTIVRVNNIMTIYIYSLYLAVLMYIVQCTYVHCTQTTSNLSSKHISIFP